MNISRTPNFAAMPQGIAKKLAAMVRTGRTTPALAEQATEELVPFSGLAAKFRRSGASPEQLDELGSKVVDIFRHIETEAPSANDESFSFEKASQKLLAGYGKAVAEDPTQQMFADEHAAVRTFYGAKNGFEPTVGPASKEAGKPAGPSEDGLAALESFRTFVQSRWNRIDRNGDDELQFEEIHQLAKDARYSGERLDQIALLLRSFGQFAADSSSVDKKRASVEKRTFEALSDPMHKLSQKLAAHPLLGPEATVEEYAASRTDLDNVFGAGLEPLNLKQGSIGDCWYISYLSACSAEELKEVVQPHPTKNAAVVRLAGDRERVVEAPSKVELYWAAKSDGYWGFALEEALNRRGRDSEPMLAGEHVLYDGLQTEAHSYINGGKSVGLLTADNQTDDYWDNFHWSDRERTQSIERCRDFISDSLSKGQKLFTGSQGATDTKTLENKVVGYHAYQVLSYDSESDTVRVRNPWGKNDPRDLLESSPHHDGKNDGIFTVELPEFMATFDCMYTTLPA